MFKCDNVIYTKCHVNIEERVIYVTINLSTEVSFEQDLKNPVRIGQNGKKGDGYPKQIIQNHRTLDTRQVWG
jgi:hypothetical protein